MAHERGIHEVYADDSDRADYLVWGRKTSPLTRRGFLAKSGLLAMSAALGAKIPFAQNLPAGLIPAALANSEEEFEIPGKEGLKVLNDRPISAETPPHLLDDDVTPTNRLFIRNNGFPPSAESIDAEKWRLETAGESCENPTSFRLETLKRELPHHTYQLQIECTGNGRSEFNPPALGNQN